MGWLSETFDTVFGGVDDSSQKAQIQQNKRAQEFIEEQAAQGRSDVINLQPLVDQAMTAGYGGAVDALKGTLSGGLDAIGQGSYAAQQAVLAGLAQFQNAILGLPVNNQAFQPVRLSPDYSGLLNAQLPDIPRPSNYTDILGFGNLPPGMEFSSYIKPGMTNAQLLAKANSLDLLDPQVAKNLQQHFSQNPSAAQSKYWASTGSATPLISGIGQNTSPGFRDTLIQFFNLMYPQG